MRPLHSLFFLPILFGGRVCAQNDIENVIVETYYISNANDTADISGGTLPEGSKTYRVFLDLCAGCALRAIYGDADHPLEISSTANFFNHEDRGHMFGHLMNNGALNENTAALDSWLSLGGASNSKFGILKSEDTDSTNWIIPNDDPGFLENNDPLAGIPLTQHDGLAVGSVSTIPPTFSAQGVLPDSAFNDSTLTSSFLSDSTHIGCSSPGMMGPTADNKILIAQLTTTGEISFHFNIEIEKPGSTDVIRYVATDTLLTQGETPSGLLSYPPVCGCTDPDFLEYDPSAGCDDGSCATEIVFGCLDPNACNYDPSANFDIPALCCYGPDSCNGLDISILCPGVGIQNFNSDAFQWETFPNPASDLLHVRVTGSKANDGLCFLLDRSGRVVRETRLTLSGNATDVVLDMADLPRGVYLLRLLVGAEHCVRVIIKN